MREWRFDEKGRLVLSVTEDSDRIEVHQFNKGSLKFDDKKKGYYDARLIVFEGLTKKNLS